MRPSFVFLIGLFFLFSSNKAQTECQDLANLKLYRTYYHLQLQSKTAHQLEVWFQFREEGGDLMWRQFQLAVQKGHDTSKITTKDYLHVQNLVTGRETPPTKYKALPSEIRNLEEGIKEAVLRNHNQLEITDIQIHYLVHAARLNIHELVPISTDDVPYHRLAFKGHRFVFVDFSTGKFYRQMDSVAVGAFDLKPFGPPIEKPNWVNFLLPKNIEGSSLIAVTLDTNPGEAFKLAEQNLMREILEHARKLERGEIVNSPLESLLQRQGETLLPEGIKQNIELAVEVYGRTADINNQLEHSVVFTIPVRERPFKLVTKDSQTGIIFTITADLSLEKPEISIKAETSDGTSEKMVLVSRYDNPVLIKDGPRITVNGPPFFEGPINSMTLPGNRMYTQFDIFPQGNLLPSYLTIE